MCRQLYFILSGEPNIPGQEWIQFDLGRVRTVYGIVTRGRADYEQWVETYMVYYAQELNKWDELVDMLGLDTVVSTNNFVLSLADPRVR